MATPIESFLLGDRPVPRVWVGLWQLSSPAWGTAPAAKIRREMARHVDRGYTAFGMIIPAHHDAFFIYLRLFFQTWYVPCPRLIHPYSISLKYSFFSTGYA